MSSEEDMVHSTRARWCRGYRVDRTAEAALFGANAEALAEANGRAQETRCDSGAARASVKQPPRRIGLRVKEAMVKEVRTR